MEAQFHEYLEGFLQSACLEDEDEGHQVRICLSQIRTLFYLSSGDCLSIHRPIHG
jgi:hypothetical protein